MKKHNQKIEKFAAIFLRIGIIAGVSFGFYVFQPAEKVVAKEAEYNLKAEQLYVEFAENEEKANEKYLNKVVAIDGEVTDIYTHDNIGAVVTLNTNNMFGVSCSFPANDVALKLNIGDQIIVKGLCTGILMDVVLIKCSIEKQVKS